MHRSHYHHRVLGALVLALFMASIGGFAAQTAAAELHDVLSADLGFSRVFHLLQLRFEAPELGLQLRP